MKRRGASVNPGDRLIGVRDAAAALAVSYATLKQWIYEGKIQTVRTAGGHHRVPQSEIRRLLGGSRSRRKDKPISIDSISGRNKLAGTVTDVRYEGLLAQVTIDIGSQEITAIITRSACEELGLRPGVRAFALMKATEVMVVRG